MPDPYRTAAPPHRRTAVRLACPGRSLLPLDVHASAQLHRAHHQESDALAHHVLREDLSGSSLLTKANLDEAALMTLSRSVATIIGLPESTEFTSFHPAKLFDFSTRARCLAPFRILGVRSGGATEGQVVGMDLEAQPFLRDSESEWYDRALAQAEAEVAKRHQEREELERAIRETQAMLQNSLEKAADSMVDRALSIAEANAEVHRKREDERNSGVEDHEWDDDDGADASKEAAVAAEVEATKEANSRLAGKAGQSADELPEQRELSPEEERQMQEAQLELYQRSLKELEEKLRIQQGHVDACIVKRDEWKARVNDTAGGVRGRVPVFPIGDSLLEPFWQDRQFLEPCIQTTAIASVPLPLPPSPPHPRPRPRPPYGPEARVESWFPPGSRRCVGGLRA